MFNHAVFGLAKHHTCWYDRLNPDALRYRFILVDADIPQSAPNALCCAAMYCALRASASIGKRAVARLGAFTSHRSAGVHRFCAYSSLDWLITNIRVVPAG